MGLLSRASTLDENVKPKGLAFSDFINKYSFKICALLDKNAADYFVMDSIGFDARSVLSAISTADFWQGICPQAQKIYYFSGLKKSPLMQLLSANLKESILDISVYKNSASQIFFCQGQLSEEAARDFDNILCQPHKTDIFELNPLIKKSSVVLLLKLNFSQALDSFLSSEYKNKEHYQLIKEAITKEFYNRFPCRYNLPDASCMNGPFGLKTVFVSGKAYSIELITSHMILNLKEVLENYAEQVQITFAGTADSCEKVKSFLQAE